METLVVVARVATTTNVFVEVISMRGRCDSIIGQRYGYLTVIDYYGKDNRSNTIWLCKCDCGNIKPVKRKDLVRGSVKSCGCMWYPRTRKIDLTGERFGRLVVIGFDHMTKSGHSYWKCKCDCGNIRCYSISNLRHGSVRSCGCLRRDLSKARTGTIRHQFNTAYGQFGPSSPIVKAYRRMVNRCYNKDDASHSYYYDNGITISENWFNLSRVKDDNMLSDNVGIVNFINDMYAEYKSHVELYGVKNTSLDRIDGTKGYAKNNCRWATYEVQNNNLSSNRHIYDGEEILTFAQCAKKYIPSNLLKGSYAKKPGTIIGAKIDSGKWTVNQILAWLKHIHRSGEILDRSGLKHILIRKIDQSCVYEKYPNEKRLPGYEGA